MWPFSRKPKPINPGPINEDWRVGDLAECVLPIDREWYSGQGPERGDVLKVRAVSAGKCFDGVPMWGLKFDQYPRRYFADGFRKVPPLNSEASAEFTAKIKSLGHRKVPAK